MPQHMMANRKPKFPIPHPTEYIVAAWISGEVYDKIAQFKYRAHADNFRESVRCFATVLIAPAALGIAR